jgi:DNA segregation ATPase FtsK/SpoIIIE-like protein
VDATIDRATEETDINESIDFMSQVSAVSNDDVMLLKRSNEKEIAELSRGFIKACAAYNIKVNKCPPETAIVGSGVIRFYITLSVGQALEALRGKLEDIGREMKRSNLIVQTVKNSNEVILDVPRLTKDKVLYSAVENRIHAVTSPEQLFFPIGKTPEGEDIIRNLGELPHLLVGGSTGSGKTVLLFTLLASIIRSHPSSEELGLVLSSAGVEDFIHFEGLPHLINGKIIDSAKETVDIIQTVVNDEFERRAKILSEARVSNIIEYNSRVGKTDKLRPIVIVIDEFADIADQLPNKAKREEFYSVVRRIVQIGCKRGVHMVLCTQRPSANLVPTDVKAQLNARIALGVNDANSSRMILEITGAQNLQKHGDLIYKDGDEMIRAQGYLITTDELAKIISAVKK